VDTNQFLRIIASRFIKLVGILLLGLPGALLMLPVGMTARLVILRKQYYILI